jgi:hypothetical protein
MDVKNMTLEEFLLARIAEDERHARAVKLPLFGATHPVTIRALAECDAKRRIVQAWHTDTDAWFGDDTGWDGIGWCVQVLALPYAGHPDYREEWRP